MTDEQCQWTDLFELGQALFGKNVGGSSRYFSGTKPEHVALLCNMLWPVRPNTTAEHSKHVTVAAHKHGLQLSDTQRTSLSHTWQV